MVNLNKDTEKAILVAAEEVFIEKGMAGARMQMIADRAGINKSLLHYYYRSKSKLFQFVFRNVVKNLIPDLFKIFEEDNLDFFDKLRKIVFFYIDTIQARPQIPGFVIHELSSNPKGLVEFVKSLDVKYIPVFEVIQAEMDAGRIRKMDPEQLILNVLSMCVFPFVAKPIIKNVLFQDDEAAFNALIEKRKSEVAEFVINAIKA